MEINNTCDEKRIWCRSYRESKSLILAIVTLGFFIDYILLTTVVPIVPELLYNIEHPDVPLFPSNQTDGTIDGNVATHSTVDKEKQAQQRHMYLMNETSEVGLIFSSKYFVQLFTTPLVGYLIPNNMYELFFAARSLQGFGGSCLSISGLTMVSSAYSDHRERGNAIGVTLEGIAAGTLIGPIFGGVMYEFIGKMEPFLILASITFTGICLQLLVLKPTTKRSEPLLTSSFTKLISDKQIILTSGALMMANMSASLLEATLPLWMMDTMQARRWQQGVIFTPFSIFYFIGTHIFGIYNFHTKRWLLATLAIILSGLTFLIVPLTRNIMELIPLVAALGLAVGMVETSMLPALSYFVDVKHSVGYAGAYAMGDLALCLGDAIAPLLGGILFGSIGFSFTLYTVAIICFLYSPFVYTLKYQAIAEEEELLLSPTKRRQKTSERKNINVS